MFGTNNEDPLAPGITTPFIDHVYVDVGTGCTFSTRVCPAQTILLPKMVGVKVPGNAETVMVAETGPQPGIVVLSV